jgi:hypothetical protein
MTKWKVKERLMNRMQGHGIDITLWLFLVGTVSIWALLLFKIIPDHAGKIDLSSAGTLFIALVGLFAGAIVSKSIYDYTNRYNQLREWKHDQAEKWIEEIYTPLWLETNGTLKALSGYHSSSTWQGFVPPAKGSSSRSDVFVDIMSGPHYLFIDWTLSVFLRHLHEKVAEYDKALKKARDDIYNKAVEMVGENGSVVSPPKGQQGPNELLGIVTDEKMNQWILSLYPPGDKLQSAADRFCKAYAKNRPQVTAKDAFILVADVLRNLPSVIMAQAIQQECLFEGQQSKERMKMIFRDPIGTIHPTYERDDEDSQFLALDFIVPSIGRNSSRPSIRGFLREQWPPKTSCG